MSKSRYRVQPFDLTRTRTYPLRSRPSKVNVESFGRPHIRGGSVAEFLDGLPRILAARNLGDLARAIAKARAAGKPVLWGLGAHVIKTGLSPILIDLMDRGYVSGIALNGAGMIHDFEVALVGSTSEDVESQLEQGDFGMAEETGLLINTADQRRFGRGSGHRANRSAATWRGIRPGHGDRSLLLQSYLRSLPVTVHVTIGADIIHNHPACSPGDTGDASHRDFRLFASLVAGLDGGGVYLELRIGRDVARGIPEMRHACAQQRAGAPGFHHRQP